MPELNTFECKVCGVTKRDVNHWWIVWVAQTGAPVEKGFGASDFSLELWATLKRNPAWPCDVACGEEHAQQLFGRWLVNSQSPTGGSFDAPSQRPVTRSVPIDRDAESDEQARMPALQDSSVPTRVADPEGVCGKEDPHE